MNEKVLFSVLLILGGTVMVHTFRPPKCRGKEIALTPEELETMEECVKEYSTGGSVNMGDVPWTRIGCVGKCIMRKQGLTDEKGVPVKDNIFQMVNGTLDAEVVGLANEKLGKCVDENSAGIDIREKACKSYWPLVKCVMGAFQEICADPLETSTEHDAESES